MRLAGHLKCSIRNIIKYGFIWLIICMIAGGVAAYELTTVTYMFGGLEIKRIYYIYKNLHDSTQKQPEIAVFGDSAVMNGIDCKLLTAGVAGNPVAWNLSSTGQYVSESMMITEELPDTVKTIILGVRVTLLIKTPDELSQTRAIPYKLYGFRISPDVVRPFEENGLEETVRSLNSSQFANVMEARSWVMNSVDTQVRKVLRKDLNLESATADMFYPSPYTKHVSEETLMKTANKQFRRRTADMGRINPAMRNLYDAFGEMAKKRNCRFILIVMPEQPLHKKWDDPEFYASLNKAVERFSAESKFEVWDFRELLEGNYFVDLVHPDSDGAKILTGAICEKLNRGRD